MASPRIAVLLPCYNEEAAIAKVIAGFNKALPGAVVYVYDNARDRSPVRSVREWRVGSRHSTASALVADALDANRERRSVIAGIKFPTFPTL